MIHLSVIIPAFNEQRRIVETLESIGAYLSGQDFDSEVILVDDGSTDETVEKATETCPSISIIKNEKNMGKGHSVRRGVLASKGELVLFTDADLSTPIDEFEKLAAKIDEGFDIAIGSRSLPDSEVEVPQGLLRQSMGKTFNLIVRTVVLGGYVDTQCGFKCFTRDAAERVFTLQKIDGFGFDVELLYIASLMGLKTDEVPVRWINSPESKVDVVGGSTSMLIELFRIKLNGLMGLYKTT